jgi:hypothetical protein
MRLTSVLALVPASVAMTGCHAATDAAAVAADLRPQVDGQRQCAALIAGAWPIDWSADTLRTPGIDALVAAGLITRDPVTADPEARPTVHIAITEAGKPWIELRRLNPGGAEMPFLCYGDRKLETVSSVDPQAGTARYSFRVVNPPAWTQRTDIRGAFPFLGRALAAPIEASAPAIQSDGKWKLPEHSEWLEGAALERKGFYPCQADDRENVCG